MEAEADAAQPPPTSPGVSPLQLDHCVEELLKAVLQWSINGTLGLHIGLSPDFCSALLSERGNGDRSSGIPASSATDSSEGIHLNPLYKSLASALHQSMASGNFCNTWNESNREREDLLPSKGSQLLNILKKINFEFHVQEPFFSQLKEGLKTVEGRCAVGDYNRIYSGALILIAKCLVMEVVDVHRYMSFAKMLETEGLSKVLPGVGTIEEGNNLSFFETSGLLRCIEQSTSFLYRHMATDIASLSEQKGDALDLVDPHPGVAIYRQFYTEEKEKLNGVLALCVSKTASQPYMVLADIISILGYQGIQSLLGFQHPLEMDDSARQPA